MNCTCWAASYSLACIEFVTLKYQCYTFSSSLASTRSFPTWRLMTSSSSLAATPWTESSRTRRRTLALASTWPSTLLLSQSSPTSHLRATSQWRPIWRWSRGCWIPSCPGSSSDYLCQSDFHGSGEPQGVAAEQQVRFIQLQHEEGEENFEFIFSFLINK